MKRWPRQCNTRFDIYTPNDITACPKVVIVCRGGPHSHPEPSPIKIPPQLLDILESLLLDLDWKLGDATPRKIVLDSRFMQGLRKHLGWSQLRDPSLSDLHPSLGNMDHVRRYINKMRDHFFPSGTRFEGMLPCLYPMIFYHDIDAEAM